MKRRLARELAVQSLYQMEMNEVSSEEAVQMLLEEVGDENEIEASTKDLDKLDAFTTQLVRGVSGHLQSIDDVLQQHLTGWQVDRLSRVDRQILRLACYELMYADDAPPKAVVNEAIELAKHFGTEESGKFVNGVLGKLLRALEMVNKE